MKDEWQTPEYIVDYLQSMYGKFTWDACCNKNNCLVDYQRESLDFEDYNYLNWISNGNDLIFLNPPYSNIAPFIKKAWTDSLSSKVIVLVPITVLSCKYMDFLDEGNEVIRKWVKGLIIETVSRRIRFTHHSLKQSSPPAGSVLIIMDRRGR